MRTITRWTAALFLIGLGGCGGGSGHRVITYTLDDAVGIHVPAGYCGDVSGPFTVGAGSMGFTIVDTPTGIGSDSMEVGIVFESDFAAGGCDFSRAIVDDVGTGSVSDAGNVAAGTYTFIVGCNNIVDDCIFDLTWTATY